MTQPALENSVSLDWFKTHTRESLRKYLATASGSAGDLTSFLSPFSTPYHSALNPVFLAECESLRQLDYAPVWLARDGLLSLVWFFSRFPVPQGFRGRVYLHGDLVELAPDAWRPRIGTYRFGELPRSKFPRNFIESRAKTTRLLLLGISSPAYCGLEHLRELLSSTRKKFSARFGHPPREVLACFVQKTEPLGIVEDASRHSNAAMLEICMEFGAKVRVIDLRDLPAFCKGSAILDVNEGFLCADGSLVHAAVGQGAMLLDAPLAGKRATYERTTLTHGFELQDRPGRTRISKSMQRRLEDAMSSPANTGFPWQFWSERKAQQEAIRTSALTGYPRILEKGPRRFGVLPSSSIGSLDVAYLGIDKLDVHGWSADPVHDRAPVEVAIFRDSRRLVGNMTRTTRADVQSDLGRKFDEAFRPGFEFSVPRSSLKEIRKSELFSVYGLFGHDLAVLLGQFRLEARTGSVERLPARNAAVGSYVPVQLNKDRVETFPRGKGARPVSYAIGEVGGHYQARIDLCELKRGELSLTGWAADFLRASPAEAILVYGGSEQALVFPLLERRSDIAKSFDYAEVSGFSLISPWIRPRVFVLFDTGVAIELPVPARGGSA